MNIKYIEDFNIFIIEDVFEKGINEKIMDEINKHESMFENAVIGGETVIVNPDVRSNTVLYYDEIYKNKRKESVLLSALDDLFENRTIRTMLETSPFPLFKFLQTNTHETQVSRYGDDEQKYDWHTDNSGANKRLITFVYYPIKEPIKFTGGDIQLTRYPIIDKVHDKEKTITIKPKSNLGIFFPSNIAHRVLPTKSSNVFSEGRFSVNCWIGMI